MAAGMTPSVYDAWASGQLPLRSVLGTPEPCLDAALELASRAEAAGDLALAETILRGLCALDPRAATGARALARVLLARAIASSDGAVAREALAWATHAARLEPHSAASQALSVRAARVSERLGS